MPEPAATILVVDDNPAGLYATSRVLRSASFAVIEASTGNEGLALVPGVDLVVLDVNLPDISGFDVCRRIRSSHETSRIPVIHLSATFVKDTDKVEGLEAGADGYLTHPVEPPVLVATINAFLRARRAEDEMRRSEAKFKAIFDQALSGILLVSKDLLYLEANPAMCQILGRTREEIVGRHHSSFVPAGREEETQAVARAVEERGSWRGTFPLLRADGTHVELDWSIARHSVPGVRLAIVNDVTERKAHEAERERLLTAERAAREEAEQANRLKDEFLATLSHELRTPLSSILLWSHLLETGGLADAERPAAIRAIAQGARAQQQLIEDLLDVSRITSGKVRLEIRPIDPAAVIDAALEAVAPAMQAKEIRLQRILDPNAGPIPGDANRIQQVIWNLVNNAVKFTPRGGTIGVTLAREDSHVAVTVSDNGRGIKADFLPHIFERFRQEDATTKRNQGGLGLGLAIVKHLVEMHGGTVAANSEGEGRGTTFTVRLPISAVRTDVPADGAGPGARFDSAPVVAGNEPAVVVPDALRGVRVLIVEDDPDARRALCRVLTTAGAEVRDAGDVTEALRLVDAAAPPDVLVSDIGMPHRDGFDLIEAIRARGHLAARLPAIALTAFARGDDRDNALEAGFQLHVPKPVNPRELVNAIATLARARRTNPK